jgi:cold-inducible RNA-binding protein
MGKKLYVGNLGDGKLYVGHLGPNVTNRELRQLFKPHGTVRSAEVIMDPDTSRSKGFGFVQMTTETEAQAAISALSGRELDSLPLGSKETRAKDSGSRRS